MDDRPECAWCLRLIEDEKDATPVSPPGHDTCVDIMHTKCAIKAYESLAGTLVCKPADPCLDVEDCAYCGKQR